eukprot:gene28870-34844_t
MWVLDGIRVLLLVLVLALQLCTIVWSIDHSCCRLVKLEKSDQNGTSYYLWKVQYNSIHMFPDLKTLDYYGFNLTSESDILVIPPSAPHTRDMNWTMGDPIQKITLPPVDVDMILENMLQRIRDLYPQPFWRGYSAMSQLFNPSLTKWKDKYIIAYRHGRDVEFSWVHYEEYPGDYNFSFTPDWNDNTYALNNNNGRHSWNNSQFCPDRIREDPRLIVVNHGQDLVVTFARWSSLATKPDVALVSIRVNNDTQQLEFDQTVTMRKEGRQNNRKEWSQMNWTPLLYRNQLYYLYSMNPHMVLYHNETETDESTCRVGKFRFLPGVDNEANVIELPWSKEYGHFIRGGSPAMLVRGLYLAFFHTSTLHWGRTQIYFMGAVTFCPHPPFKLHSMSPHPILRDEFYHGPWRHGTLSYRMYPTGSVLDDKGEHVFVSFGYQDRKSYVAKFNLKELLGTLVVVQSC